MQGKVVYIIPVYWFTNSMGKYARFVEQQNSKWWIWFAQGRSEIRKIGFPGWNLKDEKFEVISSARLKFLHSSCAWGLLWTHDFGPHDKAGKFQIRADVLWGLLLNHTHTLCVFLLPNTSEQFRVPTSISSSLTENVHRRIKDALPPTSNYLLGGYKINLNYNLQSLW